MASVPSPVLDARDLEASRSSPSLRKLMGGVLKPGWVKSVVVGAEPGILTPRTALIFVAWNRLGVVLWPQERADLWRLRGRSQLKGMTLSLSSPEEENQPLIHSEVPGGPSVGGQGGGGGHREKESDVEIRAGFESRRQHLLAV